MDQSVLDALKRWPNVPAVYGWLSLSARGAWRLHPLGDAQQGGLGEGISNSQILGFMNRNYSSEPDGRWFFQNGPQRVYVRLDGAPYILHLRPECQQIVTHNELVIDQIGEWLIDEQGQLYAKTNLGPARMDDRDLLALSDVLTTQSGLSLLDVLELTEADTEITLQDATGRFAALQTAAPLARIHRADAQKLLGFIANPTH